MSIESKSRVFTACLHFAIAILGHDPEPLPPTPPPPFSDVDWTELNLVSTSRVPRWEVPILIYANKFGIPWQVISVTMDNETQGRTEPPFDQLAGDGVCLMGIMPRETGFPNRPTAEELLTNPDLCIRVGSSILAEIYYDEGLENWYLSFIYYNAGIEEKLIYGIDYADKSFDKLDWETPVEEALITGEIPDYLHTFPNAIKFVLLSKIDLLAK